MHQTLDVHCGRRQYLSAYTLNLEAAINVMKARVDSISTEREVMKQKIENSANRTGNTTTDTTVRRISLKRYEKLSKEIVIILRESIEQGGTTLRDFVGSNNKPGYFKQQLEVYGRQGEECKLCSSVLKSLIIGQRSSVYCPKCQN